MTAPARDTDPAVTDRRDVRMRVRVGENGSVVPIRPDMDPGFAYTRAIPRSPQDTKDNKPGKFRNFVSQHAGESAEALTTGWLGADRPRPLVEQLGDVIPARTDTPNLPAWVGLLLARTFRLTVHALAYLACAATDTDKRAAMAGALTLLTFTIAAVVAALT